MRYNHNEIEARWQKYWAENGTFRAEDISDKPKYYVLDMFPYPSGAGLHVGHPLGYIASDIYARYKRHQGFNVLHPQGYDSFGLPAEQYAIQTGQHPAVTTEANIARYRQQLDRIGFSFDWDREVRTSDPEYYKWTQWIFIQLFNSWYNNDTDKAESICTLIAKFEKNGTEGVNAVCDDNATRFTAPQWKDFSKEQQEKVLLQYRLTYLAETEVNWCPALGTVLANDEIVNGVSERGGYPVIRKKMTQWSMRISAYAERLLQGLETIDWTESLKESQRNWIGKSVGASVTFRVLPPTPSEGGGDVADSHSAVRGPGYLTGNSANIKDLLHNAKTMRKEYTVAEAVMWEELRRNNLGVRFRRQHPVGNFIPDFVCLEKRLIVEVDGGYHNEPEQAELDEARTFELEQKHHFKILRFTNEEVMYSISNPISQIRVALANRKTYTDTESAFPTPPPSEGGGGRTIEGPGVRNEESPTISEGLGLKSFFNDIFSEVGEEQEGYTIEVFTTRPDTIFGVTFMTLAPEHELVAKITTPEQKAAVEAYIEATAKRSERDRMADVKNISGVFTGAYAEHPFTREPIPIWIGDYVLAGYGTGAVMAVPAGDQRDYDFAQHFNIPITNIFDGVDISLEAYGSKDNVKLMNSDFLDGMGYKEAAKKVIEALEDMGQGRGKTNYRLRDAVFSRQRYWGEPFPVYYVNGMPQMIATEHLPIRLPEVEKYLPTEDGQPPLGNAKEWYWDTKTNSVVAPPLEGSGEADGIYPLELNTMPGWAGSSWYWLRYMDPHNDGEFVGKAAQEYWQDVDLYIGGSEHATGHLLYSRFWNKFLKDRGFIRKDEPFKKLINQGMILGTSAFIAVRRFADRVQVISRDKVKGQVEIVQMIHVDVSLVNASDELDLEAFKANPLYREYKDAEIITEDNGTFKVSRDVEKMSKSKYNVVNPDDICKQYGADTLRLYEMFLGPLEQAKPWNTAGITGVSGFLKKLWRLYFDDSGLIVTANPASKEAYKTLHKTIKKVQEDIENFSFNTSVSSFMIAVNELTAMNCHERTILEPLAVIISPYAPHIAEELWHRLGHQGSISQVPFPKFMPEYLVESSKEYPVSFNGKTRFTIELPMDMAVPDIEKAILADERTQQQLNGQPPKKVIVVPGRIINIVA